MAGLRWTNPPQQAFPALADAYVRAVRRGIRGILERYRPEIENWMKANAPWTDRTGNARQTLHTELDDFEEAVIRLWFSHGMEYGWYLEGINPDTMLAMQNAGQWDIISPAIDEFGVRIWNDIVRMVRG